MYYTFAFYILLPFVYKQVQPQTLIYSTLGTPQWLTTGILHLHQTLLHPHRQGIRHHLHLTLLLHHRQGIRHHLHQTPSHHLCSGSLHRQHHLFRTIRHHLNLGSLHLLKVQEDLLHHPHISL
ncbi:hypothetical protein ES319_A12G056900v1 [Gossypium barbadense]|uniref:Uncharacterized protein n=2 Tax=Gossypium TaxID=3633 RepID=A0A5J5T6P1_GOSBA|nr:hypothetical protein ES319_A12G056900v1 [Gossypium barbadense]TYG88934.1 hypothetical protein ES288_A12G060500v1 [Gossypium darwinii]TYG88936.1 hypothetical protein ES288_A12G060700v1 [Gossypium darwinii]